MLSLNFSSIKVFNSSIQFEFVIHDNVHGSTPKKSRSTRYKLLHKCNIEEGSLCLYHQRLLLITFFKTQYWQVLL